MEIGLDQLLKEPHASYLRGKRLGLVTNSSSFDCCFRSSVSLLNEQFDLRVLYAPEHGLDGSASAGQEIAESREPDTGIPIRSLYQGEHTRLDPSLFADIDLLVFDMQDVGLRFYTYTTTLEQLMHVGVPLLVLDRPNPLGGVVVEGPILDAEHASFVGLEGLAVRYALTIGELACFLNGERNIGCDLQVVCLHAWKRSQRWEDLQRPWVMTSPAIAHSTTIELYAGFCLLEGTNLSEGRGTSAPFELFGAPFIDARSLASEVQALGTPGVSFTPITFVPSASKYQGQPCHGLYAHVTDRASFRPFTTALSVLSLLWERYPEQLSFNASFARLAGFSEQAITKENLPATLARIEKEAHTFARIKRSYELYA
jgi:uncharacterized protein YbbC (DUF1343 family)